MAVRHPYAGCTLEGRIGGGGGAGGGMEGVGGGVDVEGCAADCKLVRPARCVRCEESRQAAK
jgi:hypothetical protein